MKNVIKSLYQNYRLACIFNGCSSGNALLEQRVFAVTQRAPDSGRLSGLRCSFGRIMSRAM